MRSLFAQALMRILEGEKADDVLQSLVVEGTGGTSFPPSSRSGWSQQIRGKDFSDDSPVGNKPGKPVKPPKRAGTVSERGDNSFAGRPAVAIPSKAQGPEFPPRDNNFSAGQAKGMPKVMSSIPLTDTEKKARELQDKNARSKSTSLTNSFNPDQALQALVELWEDPFLLPKPLVLAPGRKQGFQPPDYGSYQVAKPRHRRRKPHHVPHHTKHGHHHAS